MIKILKKTVLIYFFINLVSTSFSNENFFDKGLELYKNKKYDDARFMFERSIVFNPKTQVHICIWQRSITLKKIRKKKKKT